MKITFLFSILLALLCPSVFAAQLGEDYQIGPRIHCEAHTQYTFGQNTSRSPVTSKKHALEACAYQYNLWKECEASLTCTEDQGPLLYRCVTTGMNSTGMTRNFSIDDDTRAAAYDMLIKICSHFGSETLCRKNAICLN